MDGLPRPSLKLSLSLKRPAPGPASDMLPKARKVTLKVNAPASLALPPPPAATRPTSEPPLLHPHVPYPISTMTDTTTTIAPTANLSHSLPPLARAPSLPVIKIKPPSVHRQTAALVSSNIPHPATVNGVKQMKKGPQTAVSVNKSASPAGILKKPKTQPIPSSLVHSSFTAVKDESPPALLSSSMSATYSVIVETESLDVAQLVKMDVADDEEIDIDSLPPDSPSPSKPTPPLMNDDDDYESEGLATEDDRVSLMSYDDDANERFADTITRDPNYQNMKIIDTTSFIPKKAGLSATALVSSNDVPPPPPDFLTSKFPLDTDFRNLDLVPDHASRPLMITPDGTIVLEGYSSLAPPAKDFLTTVAEPSSRPARMHEYKLTSFSLYAAVSVGVETSAIINTLKRLCKTVVPRNIIKFIKECTQTYGKVRLLLKDNKYHVESAHPEILSLLLKDEIIASARVLAPPDANDSDVAVQGNGNNNNNNNIDIRNKTLLSTAISAPPYTSNVVDAKKSSSSSGIVVDELFGAVITIDREDEDSSDEEEEGEDDALLAGITQPSKRHLIDLTESFEIQKSMVEVVRRRCRELDYPLLEEYAYTEDSNNPTLDLTLKGTTAPRDYQAKALYKLLGAQNRARSGIVVLPTGAGKTLVGIAAATAIKKSVLVLCTNALSVSQWHTEFNRWANVPEGSIAEFTALDKAAFTTPAGVLITTYTMLSNTGERAAKTLEVLDFINAREWGLVILDEVHVIPAKVFRRVLTIVAAHAKLGLTATLVREDDKIQDLNFLIGPKLYEADWLELMDAGHIARVECTEVWCPMPSAFYDLYMKSSHAMKRLISVVHPGKFNVCQWLIRWRESLGDRILVFSDNVFALEMFAKALNKPLIHGKVHMKERMGVLKAFKRGETQTVFLSKVGDTSLDLPEATCLIQINSQFGSRRQEAQRLGRILRAKRRNEPGFKAMFYTLVSKDTDEVFWSNKRRTWLIDQGFEFNIIDDIFQQIPADQIAELNFVTPEAQLNMLREVQNANENDAQDEVVDGTADGFETVTKTGRRKAMTRNQREKVQKQQQRKQERAEKKVAKEKQQKRTRVIKTLMNDCIDVIFQETRPPNHLLRYICHNCPMNLAENKTIRTFNYGFICFVTRTHWA
ncbi:hypothetical protein SeMB42_g04011 [Synchytrium endobioticum]|uniref:DNA 3'-5' helicase n=1 Tax=Synchytrium endobioticum TaxID=286115 RepID=A0A507D1R1_9FUNG|nr:hypothetical protein SeMB42_g04011 [Synchytrium endobioticum]